MTKKKWLYIVGVLVLLIPVLLIYSAFEGNPIGKMNAKFTLKKHLEKTYPEEEFVLGDALYNFKMGGYDITVESIDKTKSEKYDFTVVGMFGTKVHYDGIYYANLDEPLIKKLEEEANEEIFDILKVGIPEIEDVSVRIEVLKGTHPDDTKWDKSLQLEKPLYLWTAIDGEGLKEEDVFEIAKRMKKILNDNGYDYSRVSINSMVNYEGSKLLNYSIGFTKDGNIKLKDVSKDNEHLDIH